MGDFTPEASPPPPHVTSDFEAEDDGDDSDGDDASNDDDDGDASSIDEMFT